LILTGETFQQKILSEDEKNSFLSQLATLGFYRIESNQKQDETDTLYDFGSHYDMEDIGPVSCVVTTEKARELCVFEPYRKFLVPEMKNILYFLDRYQPDGMTLYVPDRLFLEIGNGRTPNVDNLPETPIVWPAQFPSLEINYPGILYIEGKMAAEVFAFLGNVLTPHLVTQNGLQYTIEVVRPVLPHEVVSFP